MNYPLRLSPSTLNLFIDCPRCFWLHINKRIHRPRGIFPSLPSGMDNVIKTYFDKYRKKGELPPELQNQVKEKLFPDLELLNKWRNWRTGLEYQNKTLKVTLFGALDDCLIDQAASPEQTRYIPLDYKTRGYPPREGDSEKYYGNQLSCYGLMLEENGYPVKDFAYLVYYYPSAVQENGIVKFNIKTIKIDIDINKARELLKEVVNFLKGPVPERHSQCEYCLWSNQ